MELRWIEAFIAVAEELHFGRAAERLRMAQSPLSQTIKKLERSLGSPLFDRNTRTVSLTAAGHSFLPHARRIVDELDLARRAAGATEHEVYGRVAIGFSGALNHLTLPPLTRALRTKHPNIALSLVDRVMTDEAVQQLSHGSLDLAFVGLPMETSVVQHRAISIETLKAVLPLDHPLAADAEVDLAELADDDFVAMPRYPGSVLRETMGRAGANAGFHPRIVQEVVDPFLILSLVAAGVGISLVPECLQSIAPAGAVFVPLSGENPPRHASGI
ncbi:LysR family transcriptional regulator [Arthrobacter sp. H14]|uniref:LysR family transcriptional regulator n=1 Tax=Arthrobacter sp. H14 TaxID=1312959 RepID=UPI0004BCBF9F|nr:LysR family transcriptional regulator [Arthrobacter sp. H14]